MQKSTLCLFTNEFPYGTGENFIVNELFHHSKKFEDVILFPLSARGQPRSLESNVRSVYLFSDKKYDPVRILFRNAGRFLSILFSEFLHSGNKIRFVRRLPVLKSILLQNLYRAEVLEDYLAREIKTENAVFYSFWTDDWATVLSILKLRGLIASFVSRVHGYDLYAERWPGGLIPFRYLQLKQAEKVIAVSEAGRRYLKENHPVFGSKIYLNHLAIFDWGMAPFSDIAPFTVVSCSNLIPLKRVHLIAEALLGSKSRIKWLHFGDGPEKQRIEKIIERAGSHIEIMLMGNVPNEAVINFYRNNSVNVFIHLSETEGGVPLSLQEAACMGIPLMGTTAGGAAEIINGETGVALREDVSAGELIRELEQFMACDRNTLEFRRKVRRFWLENFGQSKYNELYNLITTPL